METAIYTTMISVLGAGLVATLLFAVRVLVTRLEDMASQIHRLGDKIDENRVELVARIDAARSELAIRIDNNGKEISRISARLAGLESRVDGLES